MPVIATDMLYEAFEPEIDWGRFGVRVAQKDIPSLGDMLDDMSEAEYKAKQVGGGCAGVWQRPGAHGNFAP